MANRIAIWNAILGTLTFVGVVVGGLAALVEYTNRTEQERVDGVLHAVQIIQSDATKQFRSDLKELIAPFWPRDLHPDYWSHRDSGSAPEVLTFIEENVLKTNDDKFHSILVFFDVAYEFGRTSPCNWLLMSKAFGADAGNFLYYFTPELPQYADRIHRSLDEVRASLVWLSYGYIPGVTGEACEDGRTKSPLGRFSKWIGGGGSVALGDGTSR